MPIWIPLVAGALGAGLGVLIESGLSVEGKSQTLAKNKRLLRRVAIALLGTVAGSWGALVFVLSSQLSEVKETRNREAAQADRIESSLERLSIYTRARNSVQTIREPWLRKLFSEGLRDIDRDLESIAEGVLPLTREQILPVWGSLVGGAKGSFLATNLVAPSDWKNVSRDGTGSPIQQEARRRGVTLARVNLAKRDLPEHGEPLKRLEGKHREAGVLVYELPYKWIIDNDALNKLTTELGTADLVLVDGLVLLRTKVRETDCKMERAWLSVNPRELALAREFFQKLLSDAHSEAQLQEHGPSDSEYSALVEAAFGE